MQHHKIVYVKAEDSGFDGKGPDNVGRTHLDFMAYAHPTHMHNIGLDAEGGLEFPKLPHRRLVHTSSLLNLGDLQVGIKYSLKDAFVAAVKWFNIKHEVNFHVTKSQLQKFLAKCVVIDNICSYKIMAYVRKKTEF